MSTQKVSIITLGCAKNQSDTDNLSALLRKRGYSVESDPAKADAIVVHTCSFIDAAKKESIETIVQAGKLKGEKKRLIVTGCMVQQHGKEMLEELPEVDAFLGTGQLTQVPDFLDRPRSRFLDRRNPGGLTDPDADVPAPTGPTSYLRLSEGCSHPCSFCVIPKLRGGLQSRPEEVIVAEAERLVRGGVQELVVIGQDTGEYGLDLYKERRLPSLLRRLKTVAGVRWIRLMYMHPQNCTEELIGVLAESPDVFPYLDMPLQHIDDRLLTEMNRKVGERDARALIERLRARAPKLALRTTFIVGFPGESDAEFEKLHAFVKDGPFDYLGAFAYSQEENTPAGIRKDQVPDEVKIERQRAISDAQYEVAAAHAESRIGAIESILIDDSDGDDLLGRTSREAPEIDAAVRLPRRAARQGRVVRAKLTGFDAYEYTAEPVQ